MNARWGEFDLRAGVWTIPASRMKAGVDHRVPVAQPAKAILREARELASGDLVFSGRQADTPLSNMTFLMAMRRMGADAVPLVAWMSREGEPATQAAVARFGDIHPMQVSKVLGTLERKLLIGRTGARGPGPAKTVAITPAGLEALKAALPAVIEVQRRLFGDEGRPGGSLLGALLDVERRSGDAAT